jgi:hypothetical protein
MPDNRFRVQGEKLARALDEFIAAEFPDRSQRLQVRRAVAEFFSRATVSAERPRRPLPDESPTGELPGDWN